MTDEQVALIARALAHPARLRILRLLAVEPECRGYEVFSELPLAQSTVSEHLRVLREAGLIESHPVGVTMVYCLVLPTLAEFHAALGEVISKGAAYVGERKC